MQAIARLIRGFCSFILLATVVGPILSGIHSSSSNKSGNQLATAYAILVIPLGFIDALVYGSALYQSVAGEETVLDDYEYVRSALARERKSLRDINETMESSRNTVAVLHELVQSCMNDNQTDPELLQIARDKLRTLKFLDTDNTVKMDTSLRDLVDHVQHLETRLSQLNSMNQTNPSLFSFSRVHFFTVTFALLLYIHQIMLWLLQHLTQTNPSRFGSYGLVLAIVLLSQSLAFSYFLQIIRNTSLVTPLSIHICLLSVRSLASIYSHTCLSDISNETRLNKIRY